LLFADVAGCLQDAAGLFFAHSLPTISERGTVNSVDNDLQLI
jgi:hypothetical protein